jgi:hypothetical protein
MICPKQFIPKTDHTPNSVDVSRYVNAPSEAVTVVDTNLRFSHSLLDAADEITALVGAFRCNIQ